VIAVAVGTTQMTGGTSTTTIGVAMAVVMVEKNQKWENDEDKG